MAKLKSSEYRTMQREDIVARLNQLRIDPTDNSDALIEWTGYATKNDAEPGGLYGLILGLRTDLGDPDSKADGVIKTVDDMETLIGEYDGTLGSDLKGLMDIKAVSGEPKFAVAASLVTGSGDSEITWTAKTKGEAGNGLSVQFTVPATSLLAVPSGGTGAELTWTGAKGKHPVSLTYAAGAADHTIAIGVSDQDITITIGTLATAAELYGALMPESSVHMELAGLISNIAKTANWSDSAVVGTFSKDFLDAESGEAVTVTDGAIEIECDYDGATDLITSTASDIQTAIEAHTGTGNGFANNLVSVAQGGAGTDPVVEMGSASNLENGEDGTPATEGTVRYAGTQIWIATDNCTISDSSGWQTATLCGQPTFIATKYDGDYTVLDTDTIIVENETTDDDSDAILLPSATGSLRRIIITNQDLSYDVVITPAGGDTIDGNSDLTLGEASSVTIIDCAPGMWISL